MNRLAPVVMFAYNRPQHTRAALESLRQNAESAHSELYVYCDGPPSHSSTQLHDAVEQTRAIVKSTNWCGHVEVIEASTNLGCDKSMLNGISQVVASCGKAVIFEDDLIAGRHLLSFVNAGLQIYEDDERVGAVSGYMYPVTHDRLPKTFFSCFLNFWGWGTWQRSWSHFQPSSTKLTRRLEELCLIERFMMGRPEYLRYLIDLQDKDDSYDIRWYATLLCLDMLVLYPGTSLVSNSGFDGTGTHLSIIDGQNTAFTEQLASAEPISLNKQAVRENTFATRAVEAANQYIWPPPTDSGTTRSRSLREKLHQV